MSSLKERCNVVINSNTRLNPGSSTSSNFTYSLNRNITRVTDIVIKSVQIPFTYYTVNSLNNVLKFNSNAISITITPGNYTTSSLAVELKTLIDTAFGDATTVITFSSTTFKLNITRGVAFNVDAAATVPTSTFAKLIGFTVSSATSTSVTGDSVINLSGPNYLVLESQFLTKATQHKTAYASNIYANSLMIIPIFVGFGDFISVGEQPSIPVRLNYKFNVLSTDILDFKIKDDLGNVINLNGGEFSMQLVFITE